MSETVVFNKVKDHFNIGIFGSQGGGKTVLCLNLVRSIAKYYHKVLVCCPYPTNSILKDSQIPNKAHLPCNDESVSAFIELCEKNVNLGLRFLIVFDDVISFLTFKGKGSNYLKRIGASSRHIGISSIWLLQNFTDTLPTVVKSSFMFMFFFYRIPYNQIESIYTYFPHSDFWRNPAQFYDIYIKSLVKYEFLFVDKSDIKEDAFIFSLPIKNEFRITPKPRILTPDEQELQRLREYVGRKRAEQEQPKPKPSGPDNRATLSRICKKRAGV